VETSVEERDQIFGDVRVGGVVAFLALFVVAREEVVDGEVDIEVGALQLAYYQVPALALEDDLGLRDEFLWDVGRRHSHHGAAAARAAGADDDRGAATTAVAAAADSRVGPHDPRPRPRHLPAAAGGFAAAAPAGAAAARTPGGAPAGTAQQPRFFR
jgi:hypothetical protein